MKQTTKNVLEFLKQYKSNHDGCSPTYQQIAEGCRLASPSVASYHLGKLDAAGLIRMTTGRRDIEVVGGQWTMTDASAVCATCGELVPQGCCTCGPRQRLEGE